MKGLTKDTVLQEYNDVFTSLGYIGNYKIELTEGAVPKQDAPRTVPVPLRDELKKNLHEMEQKGHIVKIDEPTDLGEQCSIGEEAKWPTTCLSGSQRIEQAY